MGLSAAVFILVAANACFHQVTCAPEDQRNGAPGFNNGICADSWREVCCEDGTVLRPGDPNMQCCGQQTFDPRFSSCCKGHLHQEAGLSCCNGTAYSPLNSTCCLGAVTTGVSEMVSDCCETTAFNPVTQVCCESRIHQRQPDFDCCGTECFNTTTHLCCGKDLDTIVKKPSVHHICCGKKSFDKTTHCCTANTLKILLRNDANCPNEITPSSGVETTYVSEMVSDCCETKDLNPGPLVCCESHQRQPDFDCCGKVCFNTTTHLCCGKDLDTIVKKPSVHHICCGKKSFDETTHCCTADTLKILLRNDANCPNKTTPSSVVGKNQGLLTTPGQLPGGDNQRGSDQNPANTPLCQRNGMQRCGLDCKYDPQKERCCINRTSHSGRPYLPGYTCCEGQLTSTPGISEGRCCGSVGYDPRNQICCGGKVTTKYPNGNQCCGEKSYSVLDQTKLCCSGVLHDLIGCSLEGAECVGTRIHYPQLETQCGSILHPQRGLHCCGEQTYDPYKDLCCAGHRWPGERGKGCCGVQLYDPGDPEMKCCSGHLHSLQRGHRGKCCGVHLITNASLQCCASAQKQLLYPRTPGLSCCGHFQYNTTQHYCCAGHLRRATPAVRHRENSGHCELITLDTQKAVCYELWNKTVLIGSVESMAVKENGSREVVVKNVLQIHVEKNLITLNGTCLLLLNHCSCPPLAKDGLYLFVQGANRTTISDLSTTVSPVYDLLSTRQWADIRNASTCS